MVSSKKSMKKRIPLIVITVIFVFCAVSLVATKLIYDGIFTRYDRQSAVPQELETLIQARQICQFSSGENQLTGYFYPARNPADSHGLIVYAPGFSAGGDDYLWQIRELMDYGWAVFTFDATGTLRSQGENQVGFSQSVLDLDAALKYVEINSCFGYNNLVLMGHSRGGYAACCVLAQPRDVSAVVSISGVNSAMEGVMEMSSNAIGPISYGNYGFLWLYQAMLFGTQTLELDASEIISQKDVPVLVIHGTQDTQFPVDSGSIIAHRSDIHSNQVEYLLYDAGHTDILYDPDGTANDKLIQNIHAFLLRSIEK